MERVRGGVFRDYGFDTSSKCLLVPALYQFTRLVVQRYYKENNEIASWSKALGKKQIED